MANSEWAEASNASDEGESEAKRAQWAEQYPAVRFTQALPVKLTDEEHAQRGKELEGALTEVENETRLAKEAALASKSRIELANVKVRALREIVRDGQEERAVQCERMFRIETNTVTEVRLDDGTVVVERAMTAQERQPKLPGLPEGFELDSDQAPDPGEVPEEEPEEAEEA